MPVTHTTYTESVVALNQSQLSVDSALLHLAPAQVSDHPNPTDI
jgi:hypothetical protein